MKQIKQMNIWNPGELSKPLTPEDLKKKHNLSGGFEVILTGPGRDFEEKIEKEKLHVLEMNERQKEAIKYIEKYRKITNRGYQKLNNVSNKTAYQDLSILLKRQVIEKRGTGKYVYYILKVMQGNAKVMQQKKKGIG